MKMKKGGLLLKFMSMILVIFLVTPMVLELGIVASFASTYYKKYQKDEGVYIYDDIQGSLSVTYRVYGHFYEESYGGLYAEGDMDTTETVKVPITVSVSRSYNPNSKYEDMRYKYTYDIKAQSVDGNWSAQDYTVAPGLDHDLGSWVLANGSVTASVPKISQWEGKYASTDYDKSIPISEKINTDGVSMSVSSFKDMNPDWFVKDDWYSLNVNVLKANVEFEIPAFTQLTVKWDEGVSTVYDYWSQHNHSDLGELVNGGKYLYQKGDRAYTFINLKEGYDFDYIGEGSNDHHWTDTKWNDTEKWWENSWSMANNREIYIHTKKQIKTLNLSWDSGVNMVIGHSTEGSDMQMPNGSDVGYYYGATAPACIYLNSGYDIDYIEDLNSGEKIYVSSSDWNEDNSRYDKYFEMKQDRKLKIHTKPKTYTFLQEVYMRFQNEDGSWDDWDAWDGYSYASKEEYDDHFGNPLSSIVSDGSKYTFDTSMITDDFRWNSDAYEMPEEFDDGTEFSYTVTSSNTRYISVKRKTKYIMSFDRGLTDDDSQQMDNITVGEYTSFKLPVNLYKGRSYSVNFNSNGGSNINPINGNLNYDDYCNWKDDYKGNLWGDEEEFNSQYVDNNIIFTMQWESEDITLPTPTKSDYIFGGWYEDKAYTKKVNGNTITIEPDTTHLDVTLYAKWTKEAPKTAYIRTFSGKGISSTNYASGSNINIDTEVTVTATVKTGYKFVNWTDSNGNEVSKDKDYTFAMPGNDVNLTANAELNSYPVTVNVRYQDADGNWGAYETVINSNYDYGSTVSWSNSDKINSDAVYKAAYKAASYSETVKGAVTKNIDIERNKYTITVNKGSHISSVSGGGTYYYGKKIQISATPDTGYSFSGWNDSDKSNPRTITVTGNVSYTANAKVNQYAVTYIDVADSIDGKELGRITRQIDYGVKVDGSDLGADKTLGKYYAGYEYASSTNATVGLDGATVYRIFRIHNYSITYNLDGGILPDGKSNPATYTVEDTFTLNNPAKPGYTFAGWSGTGITGSDNKTVTVAKGSTGDRSYTAQWTADTNTKYVVNHWKQNIGSDAGKHDSSNYTLAETYNLTGITDTSVTPAVKTYTGFTSPVAQTVNINGDGSTVVNYYYTRNKYKIDDGSNDDGSGDTDKDKGNGIKDITGGGEYYYEEEVSMEAVVKRGYHWHIDDDCHTDRSKYPTGWTVTKPGYGIEKFLDNTNYGTQKIRFVMPAHDVYVRADATNNSYTIEFERNGGTGNMPAIEATYAVPVTLPDNSFTKTTAFGNSTFLYWEDTKNDTTYDDKSVVESLTDEFNGIVFLKAAWDDCPEITAQERWFTVDDSQNGKITLEELLSTAKVTDDRDPDMEDKLTVKYYQANIFKQFKTDGYVMVTYIATDSSNNTTEVTVKVNIVDTVAVEQEKNTYARFIAPQYYKESYENGGLEDDSIWKKDPDYAAVLESAMNNRESMHYEYIDTKLFGAPFRIRKQACEYSDHLLEKWVFTKDDVKAVKEYVNEHGIGNLKEADALANFRIQFAHCRQQ